MSYRLHLVWTLMIQWCSIVTIFGIFANSGNYLSFLCSSGMVQSFVRFSKLTIMFFVCICLFFFRKERVQWWTLRRPFLMPHRSRKTWRNWTNSGTTATISLSLPLLPIFHAYLSLSLSLSLSLLFNLFFPVVSLCLFLSFFVCLFLCLSLSLSLSPFLCSISLCLFLSLVLTTPCVLLYRGFMKYERATYQYRDIKTRQKDWKEIYNHKVVKEGLQQQAAR